MKWREDLEGLAMHDELAAAALAAIEELEAKLASGIDQGFGDAVAEATRTLRQENEELKSLLAEKTAGKPYECHARDKAWPDDRVECGECWPCRAREAVGADRVERKRSCEKCGTTLVGVPQGDGDDFASGTCTVRVVCPACTQQENERLKQQAADHNPKE